MPVANRIARQRPAARQQAGRARSAPRQRLRNDVASLLPMFARILPRESLVRLTAHPVALCPVTSSDTGSAARRALKIPWSQGAPVRDPGCPGSFQRNHKPEGRRVRRDRAARRDATPLCVQPVRASAGIPSRSTPATQSATTGFVRSKVILLLPIDAECRGSPTRTPCRHGRCRSCWCASCRNVRSD